MPTLHVEGQPPSDWSMRRRAATVGGPFRGRGHKGQRAGSETLVNGPTPGYHTEPENRPKTEKNTWETDCIINFV